MSLEKKIRICGILLIIALVLSGCQGTGSSKLETTNTMQQTNIIEETVSPTDSEESGSEESASAILEEPTDTPEKTNTISTDEYELNILEDGSAEITKCSAKGSELVIPESIEGYQISGLAEDAISTSSYESISIPKTLINYVGNPFSSCYKLQTIIVAPDHPTLSVIDNVLFSKDGKRLVSYPRALDQVEYSIPDGVEVIGEWAFYSNESLNTIVLPESVTTIEDSAFVSCKRLKSINLSENVVVIGSRPFGSCTSLANIEVSSKNKHFEVLEGMLIDNDKKRLINVLLGTRNSSYSIPDGITTIGVLFP